MSDEQSGGRDQEFSIASKGIPSDTKGSSLSGLQMPLRDFVTTLDVRTSQLQQTEQTAKHETKGKSTLLDRALERRGLDRSAVEYIRKWVEFPDLILTPTNSDFKQTFLREFM